jgi:predicted transcriptional regulator
MAAISIELSDDEIRGLREAAEGRRMTAEALAQRWIRERLVHERERAAGGGKPMSPRARREQEQAP